MGQIIEKTLSDKKLQERIKWFPFDGQREVIDAFDKKRDIRLAAGTRWGKSMLCAYLALREFLKTNKRIALIAPTYDLADRIFEHLITFINTGFPNLSPLVSSRTPQQIRSPWGSWIKCKSSENPDSILGEEYDLANLDEAARIGKNIWERFIIQRLSSRRGKSVMISTPHGQDFFYHEWMRCKRSKDGISFHFPTITSPYFPKDEWERQKALLPQDVFLQEYEASFLPDAAAVFKNVRELIRETLSYPKRDHFYVMGVDLGKYEDFTVLTVIDKFNNHLVHFDRFQGRYPYQKEKITAIARNYNNARIIVDSTGVGEPIKDDLQMTRGLFVDDFKFSGISKEQLIDKLRIFVEQKQVFLPLIDVLIDELEAYGYQLINPKTGKPFANIHYSAPQGLHDDCVDSLGLAVWGLSTMPPTLKTPLQLDGGKIPPLQDSFI